MGAENRVEDTGDEGNRSPGKMLIAMFGTQFVPGALLNLRPLMGS